jgi:hypothetical protein
VLQEYWDWYYQNEILKIGVGFYDETKCTVSNNRKYKNFKLGS